MPFDVLRPPSRSTVREAVLSYCASPSSAALAVVCVMSPLRHFREWTEG